eukprot:767834-Hanusia_phi.AAC.2
MRKRAGRTEGGRKLAKQGGRIKGGRQKERAEAVGMTGRRSRGRIFGASPPCTKCRSWIAACWRQSARSSAEGAA